MYLRMKNIYLVKYIKIITVIADLSLLLDKSQGGREGKHMIQFKKRLGTFIKASLIKMFCM